MTDTFESALSLLPNQSTQYGCARACSCVCVLSEAKQENQSVTRDVRTLVYARVCVCVGVCVCVCVCV